MAKHPISVEPEASERVFALEKLLDYHLVECRERYQAYINRHDELVKQLQTMNSQLLWRVIGAMSAILVATGTAAFGAFHLVLK